MIEQTPLLQYDHNYYYYKCSINIDHVFIYERLTTNTTDILHDKLTKIIHINKNIPTFFHKMILYYWYIPYYCKK